MAKLKKFNNKKPLVIVPIVVLVSFALLLTYSFANFKSIKLFNLISGVVSFGHKYTVSFDQQGCTSKQLSDGDRFGDLCVFAMPSGYEFYGWYYNGNKITEDSIFNFKEDIELKAYVLPDCNLQVGTVTSYSYTGEA